ncbi:MAG: hypothetical protein JRJ69_04030 [Deltaproteobacteria bacterium]|nr:hypothetical protein [Deltaproteobacteria bacterium]
MLIKRVNLSWDEFLGINIIINSTILLFLFIYFTVFYNIFANKALFLLSVFTLSFIVNYLEHILHNKKSVVNEYSIIHLIINCFFIIYSFIVGFFLVFRRIPETYWYGNDPWAAVDVIREISQQLFSPIEAYNYYETFILLGNSGFYYFISFIYYITGISIDNMIRIGPLVFSGMCSYLVYLILKRKESLVAGLFASSILFINPRYNQRFSMLLRENMAFLIFLCLMLVLIIKDEEETDFNFSSLFIIGLFLSSIIITHPTTTIFALFIVFYYIIKNIVNNNSLNAKYLVVCIVISIILIWPYYKIIFPPFYWIFYSNNWNFPMIMFSIMMGVFFLSFINYQINNKNYLNMLNIKYFRLFLSILILSIFIHTLLVPRNFTLSACNNLDPRMFSETVNMLAIIGFVSGLFLPLDTILYSYLGFFSILFFMTNIGFQAPLERLVIYITFFQTWCAAICLDRVYNFLKKYNPIKINGDIKNLGGGKSHEYKVLGVIILLLLPSFVGEIRAITPPHNNSYTVDDVASLDCFLSTLREGDVILPHKKVEWLLYYLDVSRDYVAVTPDEKEWVESTYESTSVNDSLRNIPERWRDVKRVHVISLTNYYYDHKDRLPFSSVLENTVKKRFIGSVIVYTFNIPFRKSSLFFRGIKNIENRGSEPIIECGSIDSWDEYITSPSNIEKTENSSFIIFYTGINEKGNSSIGYAISEDGKSWVKNSDAVIEGFENPYIVVDDDVLYLYCESCSDYDIVRYETRDLVNWSKSQLSFTASNRSKYRIQESPVVWMEGDIWRMVFTETVFSESDYYCGLRYAESRDGVKWKINKLRGDWEYFYDFRIWENVVKLSVDGVNKLEEGYLFTGKFYVSEKPGHMDVFTGSFWVYDFDSWSADLTPFDYTSIDREEGAIDSVHIWRNPLSNQTLIYYVDDGISQKHSITRGILMGVPCVK